MEKQKTQPTPGAVATVPAQQQPQQKWPVKEFFGRPEVQAKFKELLGKRSSAFCTSVLQIVASNHLLKTAEPDSIYQAAAVAATLDLPLNNNLGFAYIVPYKTKIKGTNGQPDRYTVVAQFQMGYKGFIQLAQRSGQFKSIYASAIYEGQIVSDNPLDGFEFDFTVKGTKVVGYAAKFKLLNGFEAVWYMTKEQLVAHGMKYSKTFKGGLWETDFDTMASKTVIKLLLSKFAPLSVEMQKAVLSDQGVIQNADTDEVIYLDNQHGEPEVDKELERALLMIEDCKTGAELAKLKPSLPEAAMQRYQEKMDEFLNQ